MQKLLLTLISLQFLSYANAAFAYDLPPPPEKGSAVYQEDFAILQRYQNERTQEECEKADMQTKISVNNFFGPSTGVLTSAEIRQVAVSGEEVIHQTMDISDSFKDHYLRNRPYITDQTLHPCIRLPGATNRSYPSGHSAVGITLSIFLAKKFPAKREAILKQGKQIGLNRIIGGVHHPSDVAAGQSLGYQIAKDLAGF